MINKFYIVVVCILFPFVVGCDNEDGRIRTYTGEDSSTGDSYLVQICYKKDAVIFSFREDGVIPNTSTDWCTFEGKEIPLYGGFVYIYERDGSFKIFLRENIPDKLKDALPNELKEEWERKLKNI